MNEQNKISQSHPSALISEFGYAEKEITPPLGIYARNWGASKHDNATGVHRPLWLQCLVIGSQKQNQRVLITADLGWWKNNDDEERLRTSLLAYSGLEVDQLLFCLSHTHSGPSICSNDVLQPGGEFIPLYLEYLFEISKQCMEEAVANLMKGTLDWTTGVCALATNRDFCANEEYLIGFNPEKEADKTLLVGQLRRLDGRLEAVIVNYACHPTSFAHENTLISPDFVGALRETVSADRNVPCIFLQGASGDLAPKKQYVKDPEIVDANGRTLGYAVLSTLELSDKQNRYWKYTGSLSSGAPLAIWSEHTYSPSSDLFGKTYNVNVPFKDLPSVEVIEKEYDQCMDRVMRDRLWRKLNTRKSIGDRTVAEIPIWVWKLGDAYLVAQPNEAYSDYQRIVRAFFPQTTIVFINIANGYVGYLPPSDLYKNDMYAVWQTPYGEGSLEILIDETVKEIQKYLD